MGCARVNIGNRKTAQEAAEEATAYDANNLNQYTAIQKGTAEAFVPTFDADGNQTKVKTSTGIWNVVYNAENRPVTFTSEDGATVVECTYDKAPEGPEGDWTNAQRLPEGRGAVGRARRGIGQTRSVCPKGEEPWGGSESTWVAATRARSRSTAASPITCATSTGATCKSPPSTPSAASSSGSSVGKAPDGPRRGTCASRW